MVSYVGSGIGIFVWIVDFDDGVLMLDDDKVDDINQLLLLFREILSIYRDLSFAVSIVLNGVVFVVLSQVVALIFVYRFVVSCCSLDIFL